MSESVPYRRFVSGQTPLTAARLNQSIDHANANRVMVGGPGIRVVRTPHGAVVSATSTRGTASQLPARMRVQVIDNDFLECHTWDGAVEGATTIKVAKVPQLRHVLANYTGLTSLTTTDAQTIAVSDGTTDETWTVNLPYFAGCEIYATRVVGGTGVTDCDWIEADGNRKWGVVE